MGKFMFPTLSFLHLLSILALGLASAVWMIWPFDYKTGELCSFMLTFLIIVSSYYLLFWYMSNRTLLNQQKVLPSYLIDILVSLSLLALSSFFKLGPQNRIYITLYSCSFLFVSIINHTIYFALARK